MNFWHILLFEYVPYICLTVLIFGTVVKFAVCNDRIQATSTQLIDNDLAFKWGINLWHYGILLVFLGHFFGLLTPLWAYDWLMTPAFKRILAIGLGLAFGSIAFIGLLIVAARRFFNDAVSINSRFGDKFIVIWLLIQVGLGLAATSMVIPEPLQAYLDCDFWAQGIITFQPDAWWWLQNSDLIVKMHIVDGFLIFAFFPFSKLMHFLVAPVQYILRCGKQLVYRRSMYNS